MRWTVIWDPSARNDLTEIWIQSQNRSAVTAAADQIDRELAVDAADKGDDFYGERILAIEPLTFVFSIHPDDRIVRIRMLWSRQ